MQLDTETPPGAFPSVPTATNSHVFHLLRPNRVSSSHLPEPPQSLSSTPSAPSAPNRRKVRPGSYEALGLCAPLCAALQSAGYNFPTPIQRKVIPAALAGDDVVAMARTGSGKTAAFLTPLLHRLSQTPAPPLSTAARRNGPRALVIAPTRELVLQQLRFCKLYGSKLQPPVRAAVVVGGAPLEAQFDALAVCPPIVFATPGRLLQIVAEMGARKGLTLSTAETLVFDEADRLFEGTLAVETAALLEALRDRTTESLQARQTLLVSATMPVALAEFSRTRLRKALTVVRLDVDRLLSPTLAAGFLSTRADVDKDAALLVVVRALARLKRCAVVFAATQRRVEYIVELLRVAAVEGVNVGCVHGVMDQLARQESVAAFRKGKLTLLVVTDVAARGIDLPLLDVVVNYDMPATPKLFVHRVGRVGRAGRNGTAVSLVSAEELPYMLDVFLFVGRSVSFASPSEGNELGSHDDVEQTWGSHVVCMESSFVLGALPKVVVDEEVEFVRNALHGVELSKAHTAAKNAHGLYMKTRGAPSGESVRRAKKLLLEDDGKRKVVHVHPWFSHLDEGENGGGEIEQQVALLSTWRPRECAVSAPAGIVGRKEAAKAHVKAEGMGADNTPEEEEKVGNKSMGDSGTPEATTVLGMEEGERKLSARQLAMEEERRMFFMPARQDAAQRQSVKALKVQGGGTMGDDLSAFRELNDAAMDVNLDSNVDLLRSKHMGGGNSVKYWDRVAKKFVKGGVANGTSKRNLHVASREAKARARVAGKDGGKYATDDGERFGQWLKKNRKAVEEFAEQVESGETLPGRFETGLGSNDFRKGSYGRRARVAKAARSRANGGDGAAMGGKGAGGKVELKTVEEIKKERKMKARAEARRLAQQKGKRMAKRQHVYQAPQKGISKQRVIMRRK